MTSFMNCGLFAEELFSLYLNHVQNIKDWRAEMMDVFLETSTNFLLLEGYGSEGKIKPET